MPRLALAIALVASVFAGAAHATPSLPVIPAPLQVETAAGATVAIRERATVAWPADDAGAAFAARYLSGLGERTRGLRLRSAPGARSADIVFRRTNDAGLGDEGYRLSIADGGARIEAASDAGLFYGAVTLGQLIAAQPGRSAARLAPVTIVDRPRFAWRGLLLDSARHFQSPAFVERLIDWMALHKLNRLQWHLTDDQGWRIEIRKYPRLTSVGAWRSEPDRKTGRPARYGGFYSQAQIRRIVSYAAKRQVTIVPEIEMPGHSLAAIDAYPWLGAAPPPAKDERGDWGGFPYVLDPDQRTYAFMTDVLGEVMELFPSHWINIGGDEAAKDEWRASPKIQAQIKALGLANEDALQGWFSARIGAFLAAHGRRMIGWDDILAGGAEVPADAAVVSWHQAGAAKAFVAGHDVVIATDPVLYFDHRQSDLPSEPPGRGFVVTLADVYAVDPVPPTLPAGQAAHVLGVQASLWTEHMRTEADVARMALPRAAALAEVAWTAPSRKDWPDFAARLPAELARDRAMGLTPDDGALAVKADQQPAAGGRSTVTLSNQLGFGQIRYTLDGAPPGPASPAYRAPIAVSSPMTLRAATFLGDGQLAPETRERLLPDGPVWRRSQQLAACTQSLSLNLDAPRDAQVWRPYLVELMNPCWIFPQADLSGGGRFSAAVTRLPFNFQLGADAAKIVLQPPTTAAGELDVRDGCAGPLLAALPLAPATHSVGDTTLSAELPARAGRHDLCLTFTRRSLAPLWVIGWAAFHPAHEASR